MHNQNISQKCETFSPQNGTPDLLFPDVVEQVLVSVNTSKAALLEKLDSEPLPRTIEAAHFKQWVEESCVSEEITRRNTYSVSDKKDIAKLLGWKKYDHSPGWWCSGVNPYTGKKRELALTQLAVLGHNSGSFVFTLTLVGGAA